MIGQYLSNTNEIGTIHILQNILQLNKAQESFEGYKEEVLKEHMKCCIVVSEGV